MVEADHLAGQAADETVALNQHPVTTGCKQEHLTVASLALGGLEPCGKCHAGAALVSFMTALRLHVEHLDQQVEPQIAILVDPSWRHEDTEVGEHGLYLVAPCAGDLAAAGMLADTARCLAGGDAGKGADDGRATEAVLVALGGAVVDCVKLKHRCLPSMVVGAGPLGPHLRGCEMDG